MGYDDVIEHLGSFGRYQKRIYFLICLPAISCAFHKLAGVFLLAKPNYRCLLPFENENNATYNLPPDLWAMSYPVDSLTTKYSTCQYLDSNFTEEYLKRGVPANQSVRCDKWVYDHSRYESTTVTEWDMVCNWSWLTATSDALFMVGVLLGSIIFGHLSDKYGRKPIFFASLAIQLVFGITAAISPEYITYTLSRIVIGATTSGVFLVAYVIAMEMVGPSHRLYAGVICMMFFSVGYVLTAGFAYFLTNWRYLQIALTLPGVLFMTYHWFIPESARWLISKGKKEAAMANIQKAAKENKVTIPQDILDNLLTESDKKKDDNIEKRAPGITNNRNNESTTVLQKATRNSSLLIALLIIVIVLAGVAIYFIYQSKSTDGDSAGPKEILFGNNYDKGVIPNLGNGHLVIDREQWGSSSRAVRRHRLEQPIPYVLITHIGVQSVPCYNVYKCSIKMRTIQDAAIAEKNLTDIPANFYVGNDGYIYVGRGWDYTNAYANNTLAVCFMGDYIRHQPDEKQLEAAQFLLAYAVTNKHITLDYKLVAQNQTKVTKSPGANVYREVVKWPHWYACSVKDGPKCGEEIGITSWDSNL